MNFSHPFISILLQKKIGFVIISAGLASKFHTSIAKKLAKETHTKACLCKTKRKQELMVRRMLTLEENEIGPPWLKSLLQTSFFIPYKIHGDSNQCECNMYCLDCMVGGLCTYCLEHHNDHRIVKV